MEIPRPWGKGRPVADIQPGSPLHEIEGWNSIWVMPECQRSERSAGTCKAHHVLIIHEASAARTALH